MRLIASIATVAGIATSALGQATGGPLPAPSLAALPPSLVVLITIDQMRADYYERFREHMQFGFPRIYEGGAVFTEAYHDHAITETAPGHASLLTGRFPVHTGIATNAQGVNTTAFPVLGGGPTDPGAAPFRFKGTTLIDWLRAKNPASRFLSVSRKDRGAILPVGRSKGDVYWYASSGDFTTSTYYADTLPTWVRRFNERHLPWSYAGERWLPMYGPSVYQEPDSVPIENGGRDYLFPHAMPKDPGAADTALIQFPWMDDVTLKFALAGVNALGLGGSPDRTDVLAVSLSTTDAVGHRYGPDSKELHDHLLELDRFLGAFLDSLYTLRDSIAVMLVLTGDHGMTPFPALKSRIESNDGAQRVDLSGVWALTYTEINREAQCTGFGSFADGIVVLDKRVMSRCGWDADSVARVFKERAISVQGVARADFLSDFAKTDTTRDAIARRWLHTLAQSPDTTRLVVTLTPHSYWSTVTYATHGSPYDWDAHVPLVFHGAGMGIAAGPHADFVRTVDLAPTLADIIGVRPLETLDGKSLMTRASSVDQRGDGKPRSP
jgi:arylsulfatase A-like enzyme